MLGQDQDISSEMDFPSENHVCKNLNNTDVIFVAKSANLSQDCLA